MKALKLKLKNVPLLSTVIYMIFGALDMMMEGRDKHINKIHGNLCLQKIKNDYFMRNWSST